MGIFRKKTPSRERDLEGLVESARKLMSSYGGMGYGSKHAFDVGTEFTGYLYEMLKLGGCEEISKMLEDSKKGRSYFHDKLNWFHTEYCSGKLGR